MMFIVILIDWPYCILLTHKVRKKTFFSQKFSFSFFFSDSPTNLPDSEPLPWFSVDYRRLYDVLCQTVHTDQSTLLLYMLLHRNQHFKAYVISRTNIDQIVSLFFILNSRIKLFSFFSFLDNRYYQFFESSMPRLNEIHIIFICH